MGYQGWDKILMITLISSKKLGGYKIMSHTVTKCDLMYEKLETDGKRKHLFWSHIIMGYKL